MNTKVLKLNEFYLKIIAIITMTLDHVGVFLMMYISNMGGVSFANPVYITAFIFRCIGRIAMPLYIFMIVEGVKHTSNFGKYILRLGIVASIITLAQIIIYYAFDSSIDKDLSPFVDLILIALLVYLLKRNDKLKYLSVLPIIYLLASYFVMVIEKTNSINVTFFPFYLRASYSLFSLLLGLGFYYSGIISTLLIKKQSGINDEEMIKSTDEYRLLSNILNCLFLAITGILIFISGYIKVNEVAIFDVFSANIQSYCFLAVIPLYLYNGKRGYNKKWFNYFSYMYYPMHIVILFAIFYLIFS